MRTSPTNRNRNFLAGNYTGQKYRMHHADMAVLDPFQCRLENKRTNNQRFAFGSSHARHTYILYALPLNNRHCLIRIHHPRQILQPGKVNWHRTEKQKTNDLSFFHGYRFPLKFDWFHLLEPNESA